MMPIQLEHIALFIEMLGTMFIGFAAIRVHHNVLHERKIDDRVLKVMRSERIYAMSGIAMVVIGKLISIYLVN